MATRGGFRTKLSNRGAKRNTMRRPKTVDNSGSHGNASSNKRRHEWRVFAVRDITPPERWRGEIRLPRVPGNGELVVLRDPEQQQQQHTAPTTRPDMLADHASRSFEQAQEAFVVKRVCYVPTAFFKLDYYQRNFFYSADVAFLHPSACLLATL